MGNREAPPARNLTVAAPTGGLNARDALADMPDTDAVTMDNWFPTPTSVNLRNGSANWVTGLPGWAETLMVYNSATAQKLFAASVTSFYDVTAKGVVGAAVVTGLTNARWQYANVGTAGGQFLLSVNGADKLRGFNGTSWWADGDGTHDITGVDTSTCIQINLYKNRVFLVQKNSFKVWYLPVSSIAGAASAIDFSPLFRRGGYMMAMATWTVDNAAGIQEYAIFISSEGEVVMYLGTDPSTAANWTIQGTFHIGRPIGRRCFAKVGSDVVLVSADGFFPLSKALLTDRSQEQDAISNKIVNLVNADVQNYAANFGWDIILYPIGNKIIINVPVAENASQYQYVMNTVNGSWCRFTGWNATCFAVLQDSFFYGGNGVVVQADTGFSDNGAYINGELKTAFQYFGARGYQKQILMVRPIINTAGKPSLVMGMDMDFADTRPTGTPSFSGIGGTLWNVAGWNTFPWGDVSKIKKDWQTVPGVGDAGALHMLCVNNVSPLQLQAIEYLFQVGGVL